LKSWELTLKGKKHEKKSSEKSRPMSKKEERGGGKTKMKTRPLFPEASSEEVS